jgi:hypothetical protein
MGLRRKLDDGKKLKICFMGHLSGGGIVHKRGGGRFVRHSLPTRVFLQRPYLLFLGLRLCGLDQRRLVIVKM